MSKPISITVRKGQVREFILANGQKFKLTLESQTRAELKIEPGDAIKSILLDEMTTANDDEVK